MTLLQSLGYVASCTETLSTEQQQTKDTFSFKWLKDDGNRSDIVKQRAQKWLIERYCDGDAAEVDNWLNGGRKTILDAGCGIGFSSMLLFGERLKHHDFVGVDISDSVEVARKHFAEAGVHASFIKSDLMSLQFSSEVFDIIFSEGVLHHTDNTFETMRHLCGFLKPGGKFMFYIYAKKSSIREYTDDYIRSHLSGRSNDEAWLELEPLTKLGIELGKIKATITVPEDIPYLDIKAGEYDLQRFIYYNFIKMYYDEKLSVQEMNRINFDWYRPLNCHRHNSYEVKQWCHELALQINRINIQPAGITIVATKI